MDGRHDSLSRYPIVANLEGWFCQVREDLLLAVWEAWREGLCGDLGDGGRKEGGRKEITGGIDV
jgi:hypothetical protein